MISRSEVHRLSRYAAVGSAFVLACTAAIFGYSHFFVVPDDPLAVPMNELYDAIKFQAPIGRFAFDLPFVAVPVSLGTLFASLIVMGRTADKRS